MSIVNIFWQFKYIESFLSCMTFGLINQVAAGKREKNTNQPNPFKLVDFPGKDHNEEG